MNEIRLNNYAPEQKIAWWGQGEWVAEPDEVNFDHADLQCKIIRMCVLDGPPEEDHHFGGYLNGYVKIPEGHPLYGKDDMFSFDVDMHGGITHCGDDLFEGYWIGFDCAHSTDIVPSLEKLKEEYGLNNEMTRRCDCIFPRNYKNIAFVMEECKSLAEQVANYGKKEVG